MAYPIHTPLDNRINKLKSRIHDKHGKGGKKLGRRLGRLQTAQYVQQQKRTPPDQLPWNAQAETTIGGLNRDYQQTEAQLGAQRQTTEQDFGFAPQYSNPATNPYSRAALLEANYRQNRAATLNTYAGRGQLYAGSTQNAANYDLSQQGQALDSLQKQYQGSLTGIAGQELQAKNTLDEGTAAARAKALEDALNAAPEPGEAPGVPKFVTKNFNKRIRKARKGGHQNKARKLRQKLAGLTNPNPMP